jgi:capsular exopolysaccharide synthesis family protein
MSRVHDAMQRAGMRPIAQAPVSVRPQTATVAEPPSADTIAMVAPVGAAARDTVLDPKIDPSVVDELRKLASAVHQARLAQDLKVFTIVSSAPEEGKSMTALNLALTLASSYNLKVLLIDADLRAPSIGVMLGVPPSPGLTELLSAPSGASWPLHQVAPSFVVLTAGQRTRDPISRISSVRLKEILTKARERFDAIIIDTPPIGPFPDAALLSAMSDAALLVIGAGATPCRAVQRAVEIIGEEKILGVVLNGVDWAALSESYGYYGRYRPSD